MTTKDYQEWLIASLKDPKRAIAYLNTALEECIHGDEESQKVLLIALMNVAEAQGGVSKLAKKSGLGKESLYKTLSKRGNPKLSTIAAVIHAMGFDLKFHLPTKR